MSDTDSSLQNSFYPNVKMFKVLSNQHAPLRSNDFGRPRMGRKAAWNCPTSILSSFCSAMTSLRPGDEYAFDCDVISCALLTSLTLLDDVMMSGCCQAVLGLEL